MAHHGLDDGDDLAGRLESKIPLGVFQVPHVALAGQHDLLAGHRIPGQHPVDVAVHLRLIISGVSHGVLVGRVHQFGQTAALSAGRLRQLGLHGLQRLWRQPQLSPQRLHVST